jgi:hypothetical protein
MFRLCAAFSVMIQTHYMNTHIEREESERQEERAMRRAKGKKVKKVKFSLTANFAHRI